MRGVYSAIDGAGDEIRRVSQFRVFGTGRVTNGDGAGRRNIAATHETRSSNKSICPK